MTERTYETVVSQGLMLKVEDLRACERHYLKLAGRALKAAKEAAFFDDDDEFYDLLLEESKYRAIADMYAREAADLLRQHREGWVV